MKDLHSLHISIDLETFGTASNAAIVALGACAFRLGRADKGMVRFYNTVELESALRHGAIDASTLKWWMADEQTAARHHLFSTSSDDLRNVLEGFRDWIWMQTPYENLCIWGNGSSFDCVILENAMKAVGVEIPWKFWEHRDLRTLKALCPTDTVWPKPELAHHAGFDAVAQARQIQQAYALLGLLPKTPA